MLNRRKAMIGWLVYTAGKPMVKRAMRSRAKAAVPGREQPARAAGAAGIVAALGALLGGLLFWRKRRSQAEEPFES